MSEAELRHVVAGGTVRQVRKEDSKIWVPVSETPFSKPPPKPVKPGVPETEWGTIAVIGGSIILAAVGAGWWGWAAAGPQKSAPTAAAVAPPPPGPAVSDPLQGLAERIAAEPTLAGALRLSQPLMQDITVGQTSPGTSLLAGWAAGNLYWGDLASLPKTTYGMVIKQPFAERGKKLCFTGEIAGIKSYRSGVLSISHNGAMGNDQDQVVGFTAVGESGDLVAGSTAQICGVVTGLLRADDGSEGVAVVGMFKLPENLALKR